MPSRSEILQQQIDELKKVAPPSLTQAERDQIMKSRRGQAEIDAGRKAISDRERAVGEHSTKLNELFGKLDEALKDEGKDKTRQTREEAASPLWNIFAPSLAGAAGGAGIGEIGNRVLHGFNKGNADAVKEIAKELGPVEKLTNSQLNRSRMAGAAAAAEKYMPSSALRQASNVAARGVTYGAPAGLFYNEYGKYADRAADPNATDADKAANQRIANALLGVSTGIAADGGLRLALPSRHPGEGEAMARINAARDYAKRMDDADETRGLAQAVRKNVGGPAPTIDLTANEVKPAVAPPKPQAALPPPETPTSAEAKIRHRDRLVTAAREAGATGQMTKSEAAHFLAKSLTDSNRGAVAKALGVANGPNLQTRLLEVAKTMASKPGTSVIIPGAIGYSVYDALRSPAQAGEDGEASSPMSAPGAAAVGAGAAGATGLGIEGVRRLAQGPLGQAMMKGIGRVAGPVGAAMTAYDVGRGAYDEAVKPDSLLNGPETGAMPSAPGNSGFMAQQQAAARSAYGQPPELASAQSLQVPEMPADDGGFEQLIAASEQDPELAQMLKDAILARVQQSNEQQIPNAVASQAVVQGDPMAAALRGMSQR